MTIEWGATGWFLCNVLSIVVLAFFSMMEMACVSFNRIRLQYYVSKGDKRALWLNELLQNPSSLFGTTLIMVNMALIFGSQFARDHYAALGWNPDLAPLSQVILVVVFGELAPMFAARRYAECMAFLGIPILYAFAWLLKPVLWVINKISLLCNRLLGGQEEEGALFLTAEELQKVLQKVVEEQDEELPLGVDNDELTAVATNIFQLREKSAAQICLPLQRLPLLPLYSSVGTMKAMLAHVGGSFCLVYQMHTQNVIGIVYSRDLIQSDPTEALKDVMHAPLFASEKATLMQLLKDFRVSDEKVAVVLDSKGRAIGIVPIANVIAELFGKTEISETEKKAAKIIIDRTFPADMTIGEVNSELSICLDEREDITLLELMAQHLGHRPEMGDSIAIGPFDLSVKEASLLEVKAIGIVTHH